MRKRILLLSAPLILGACMNHVEITSPPVSASIKNPSINSSRVTGYKKVSIRTFALKEGATLKDTGGVPSHSNSEEVTGARCTLESAELSASFVSPAFVNLPKFKGKPTDLHISCTLAEQSGSTDVAATLDGVLIGGASAAGLIAAAVSSGIAAGRNNWTYTGDENVPIRVPLQ